MTYKNTSGEHFKKNVQREQGPSGESGGGTNGHASSLPKDEKTAQAEIQRLAGLSFIEYERTRRGAAKELDVSVSFLDRQVRALRSGNETEGLPEIEPWPDEVDGRALITEMVDIIRCHVIMSAEAALAVVLWIIQAHCMDAAWFAPRLNIKSATKRCGKTKLLEMIVDLVPRPLPSSSISNASIYRSIEEWRPTLVIDEADTFMRDNEELRGVLNSGHSRGMASAIRSEKVDDTIRPRQFSTFAPMVIAGIGRLWPTLSDRSIEITLQRRKRSEAVERYRADRRPYAAVARRIARWAEDNLEALSEADPEMPPKLHDRAQDNWRLLITIAERIGGDLPDQAWKAALALNPPENDDGDLLPMLLADIRTVFDGQPSIGSADLAQALGRMEGRPWPEYGRTKKPITTHAIARLLRPLEIVSKHQEYGNGYLVSDFADAFERYSL